MAVGPKAMLTREWGRLTAPAAAYDARALTRTASARKVVVELLAGLVTTTMGDRAVMDEASNEKTWSSADAATATGSGETTVRPISAAMLELRER